jgi:hypothetical protein
MLKELKVEPSEDISDFKRWAFNKKYNYNNHEIAKCPFCAKCVYFSFENTKETIEFYGKNGAGNCRLMKSLGAGESILAAAICDKYLSHTGRNINNKIARKSELPDFVKLVKDGNGKHTVVLSGGVSKKSVRQSKRGLYVSE